MDFRASFCDPFQPEIIELGPISPDQVMTKFEGYPWLDYLHRMENEEGEIHFSPSFELENSDKHGVVASIIAPDVWYVFYKRPKMVKRFFGLTQAMDENYVTEVLDQSTEVVRTCFEALLNHDLDFLERTIR